ncbi:AAA family ATPase [Leptolyngbya ohadii]|uniref:AAA family ATPase n=1 Tax=Leptolyngbya ohadii TaxID=1962290 RepID=UPI000B5A0835|nr:AAA family ATPase [Leptolyngbya ohadii]
MQSSPCGQRIVVVGTSGSGKTTFAKELADRLQTPHIELDALHWEPNWTEAEPEVFRSRISQALQGEQWVVDGNYSKARDLVWRRADTLIWLDYSFPVTFYRIVKRTLYRSLTRQELWSGNRETLRQLLSKDSMIFWVLKTYARRRKEYRVLLGRSEYNHLQKIRLTSPKTSCDWLSDISQQVEMNR